MAGYAMTTDGEPFEFHIDTPEVVSKIREACNFSRVITLQLDCDELDAVLWGLKNYGRYREISETGKAALLADVAKEDDDPDTQEWPTPEELKFSRIRPTCANIDF